MKVWTAIDKKLIIKESNLTDRIKRDFFQTVAVSVLLAWMLHLDANKTQREKARWELNKNGTCYFEQIQKVTVHKTAGVQPLNTHLKKNIRVKRTRHARHCWRNKDEIISVVLLETSTHGRRPSWPTSNDLHQLCADIGCGLGDQLGAIDERERERERDSGKLMLSMRRRWWWWWYMCVYIYIYT